MKIVVIGGTGLIGSKLINKLKEKRYEAIAASPSTGVNTLTGEGLAKALEGANIVVDVANSPSFEEKAATDFFKTSGRNIFEGEKKAGVSHHIALSIVGTDLLTENGYFRAKLAQENLIKSSGIPYTIVRATQFLEFVNSIVQDATKGDTVRVPNAFIQPIAADDVAEALLKVVTEKPRNGIIDIAGPERFKFSEIAEKYLTATDDSRKVVTDEESQYFGSKLKETVLVPQKEARLGTLNFEKWFKRLS